MAALVDTNVLVYRFDGRFPEKWKIATALLRRGILEDSVPLHIRRSSSSSLW